MKHLEQVNTSLLQQQEYQKSVVMVVRVEAAEMDEMWSFVGSKRHQRWLWQAIDHRTGKVLAYVLATHEDVALKQLQQLLAPFSIGQIYTDSWGPTSDLSVWLEKQFVFLNLKRCMTL